MGRNVEAALSIMLAIFAAIGLAVAIYQAGSEAGIAPAAETRTIARNG
jgi:hypothetical protein